MTSEEKLKKIQQLLEDYSEEITKDEEVLYYINFLYGKSILIQRDVTDQELDILLEFLEEKVKLIIVKAH